MTIYICMQFCRILELISCFYIKPEYRFIRIRFLERIYRIKPKMRSMRLRFKCIFNKVYFQHREKKQATKRKIFLRKEN